MGGHNTLILTHGDCDGVCSAALYKSISTDPKIFFTHPHGILEDLNSIYSNSGGKFTKLIILDIAFNQTTWRELIDLLNRIMEDGVEVTYIDHHPLPSDYEPRLTNFTFIWGEGKSTSELTYRYLEGRIDRWMCRVALYGAIGDYSDETPFMKEMYAMWDKRLIYFEGGILTQALEGSRRQYEYKRKIIDILSQNKLPSSYDWILSKAIEMAEKEEELRARVSKEVKNIGKVSYVVDIEGSIGRAARYAMIYGGGLIGIAIETRKNQAIMSMRTYRDGPDLNKILRKIAPRFGGSGGGHPHAAGARIPIEKLFNFIASLNDEVSKTYK